MYILNIQSCPPSYSYKVDLVLQLWDRLQQSRKRKHSDRSVFSGKEKEHMHMTALGFY